MEYKYRDVQLQESGSISQKQKNSEHQYDPLSKEQVQRVIIEQKCGSFNNCGKIKYEGADCNTCLTQYYIGKGNNDVLIRKVLSKRSIWKQSQDSTSTFVNLKWQQDQKGIRYNRCIDSGQYRTVVNHLQFHQALSNKQHLFKNIERYCKRKDIELWKIVPPTFVLNCSDECCMQALKLFFDFYVKHFPKALRDREISSKVDKQIFDERRKLRCYFFNSNLKKILPSNPPMLDVFVNKEEGDYLWIVKPTFLNRGRGIQIFSKLSKFSKFVADNVNGYLQRKPGCNDEQKKIQIDFVKRNSEVTKTSILQQKNAYLNKKQNFNDTNEESLFDGNQFIRFIPSGPSQIKTSCFLLQKYLEKPLLVQSHKFDIRMWVLVTHSLKCFVFPEGYLRVSSSPFNCKDSKQTNFVHLTNNFVQKYSNDYGKISTANQMSFKELKSIMEKKNLSFSNCKQKMYNQITHSLNATISKLNEQNRKFTFEIFGYDFMIDVNGHPWLIQVNTNPSLEESSPLLRCLLPRMLDDAFKLTIDQLFYGSASTGDFSVEGYGNENMWVKLPVSY